jgi:hypothetical protein
MLFYQGKYILKIRNTNNIHYNYFINIWFNMYIKINKTKLF